MMSVPKQPRTHVILGNIRIYASYLAFLFLFANLWSFGGSNDNVPLFVGTAKYDITPSVGTPLSGYGRRQGKPSIGLHDSIYVRALSISRDDQTFVFVSLDLVFVDLDLKSSVIEKVNKIVPLEEDRLIIVATHNHSGSGAIGHRFWQRFVMGKFDARIFDDITGKIAQAVCDSLHSPIPVRVELGSVSIDDLVENRMDAGLIHPSTLKVLQFISSEQLVVARMIFMAAHPTILSSSATKSPMHLETALITRVSVP